MVFRSCFDAQGARAGLDVKSSLEGCRPIMTSAACCGSAARGCDAGACSRCGRNTSVAVNAAGGASVNCNVHGRVRACSHEGSKRAEVARPGGDWIADAHDIDAHFSSYWQQQQQQQQHDHRAPIVFDSGLTRCAHFIAHLERPQGKKR